MISAWYNPVLGITELAEMTGYSPKWWKAVLASDDHPPTIKRGKTLQVVYSDALDWLKDRYGEGGPLRGSESLDIKIDGKGKGR